MDQSIPLQCRCHLRMVPWASVVSAIKEHGSRMRARHARTKCGQLLVRIAKSNTHTKANDWSIKTKFAHISYANLFNMGPV